MMQPNQQHVSSYVKGVEWGLGTRGLRIGAEFWIAIPVEVTQETSVVPHHTHCHRDTLLVISYDTQGKGGRILTRVDLV